MRIFTPCTENDYLVPENEEIKNIWDKLLLTRCIRNDLGEMYTPQILCGFNVYEASACLDHLLVNNSALFCFVLCV